MQYPASGFSLRATAARLGHGENVKRHLSLGDYEDKKDNHRRSGSQLLHGRFGQEPSADGGGPRWWRNL